MIETRIYNDFFKKKLLLAVSEKYVDSGMSYGWKSNVSKSYDPGHWNRMIVRQPQTARFDLTGLLHPHHPEITEIWKNIKAVIGNRSLLRCYVNGYTYGTEGYAHQDERWLYTDEGREKTTETIIIYLNETWHMDNAGETVIFDAEGDIEHAIMPKFNRMLIFDSTKVHVGRSVSRKCHDLRSVLVFKTDTKPTVVSIEAEEDSPKFVFLKEHTAKWQHTGRTLYTHLTNVYQLLKSKNERPELCDAGLFHTVYGNESYAYVFDQQRLTREAVAGYIGTYAEALAWIFATTENRFNSILNNTIKLPPQQHLDLCKIELVSLLDQNFYNSYNWELDQLHEKIEALTTGAKNKR